jgi:hypothetical protein
MTIDGACGLPGAGSCCAGTGGGAGIDVWDCVGVEEEGAGLVTDCVSTGDACVWAKRWPEAESNASATSKQGTRQERVERRFNATFAGDKLCFGAAVVIVK